MSQKDEAILRQYRKRGRCYPNVTWYVVDYMLYYLG